MFKEHVPDIQTSPYLECAQHLASYIAQSSAKRRAPGFVNFVTADAHHFCLALLAAFTQPWGPPFSRALYLPNVSQPSQIRPILP